MRVIKQIIIYTDGACSGNPGQGGYAAALIYGEQRKEMSGGFRRTTNNRMEIMAAIVGLESLKQPCAVKLYTDSKYLVDSITLGWAKRWKAKNWKTEKGTRLNADLWARLLEVCARHEVKFHWVRGHADNADNARCDALAVQAARCKDLPVDSGYEAAQLRVQPILEI
jgi:ribonuclease HI